MYQEYPSPIKVRVKVLHLSLHPEIHLEDQPQEEVGQDQTIHLKVQHHLLKAGQMMAKVQHHLIKAERMMVKVQRHLIKEEDVLTRADHLDHQDHQEEILTEDHLDLSATFVEVLIRMRIAPGSLPHQCRLQAT